MDPRPKPTAFQGMSASFGMAGDWGEWKAAAEHYYWDRLEEAFALCEGLGVGTGARSESFFRTVEAETTTRRQSKLVSPSDWLTVEWIPHECEGSVDIPTVVEQTCHQIADRFGYTERAPTMVSVLTVDSDAPWAAARFGYMVDKYPYDKICIPNNRVYSETGLSEVVAHEYAHVVVLNVAQGKVPKWLNEGIAMLAEHSSDLRARRALGSGQVPWLSAHDLELAHSRERQGEPNPAETWMAYQRSAWLVRYLVDLKGESSIGQLLAAFGDNSFVQEVKMRLTGQTSSDEALRQVYGFGEKELFAQTLDWLKGK